jgi:hypothetical protein
MKIIGEIKYDMQEFGLFKCLIEDRPKLLENFVSWVLMDTTFHFIELQVMEEIK